MAEAQFQPTHGTGQQFQINQIAGYRVAGCYYPSVGIRNSLQVYVFERQDATNPFNKINMGAGDKYPAGTLTLGVTNRTLTFNDIALLSAETAISHRERLRLLTFGYRLEGKGVIKAEFKYENKKEIEDTNKLGDDYKFSLDGRIRDSLLGLHSFLTPTDKVVLRLASIPNREHASWLKTIIDLNNDLANKANQTPFNLIVGQQQIKITDETLDAILIDESYGAAVSMAQPAVGQLYDYDRPDRTLGLHLHRDKPSEWVKQYLTRDFMGRRDDESDVDPGASRRSVETATIILNPRKYNDLNII